MKAAFSNFSTRSGNGRIQRAVGNTNKHSVAANLLQTVDLGPSIAEQDTLLEKTHVETSAFTDLLHDKADLMPGTKGSGKSALFKIFADFLPQFLLENRKVVIAHGVQKHGDIVFHAFKDQFEKLSEDDFVSFWLNLSALPIGKEQFCSPSFKRKTSFIIRQPPSLKSPPDGT